MQCLTLPSVMPACGLEVLPGVRKRSKALPMSSAQTVQILITLAGILLGVAVFLFAPFGDIANGVIAFLIFIAAGTAAGFAYAKLANRQKS